MELKLKNFPRRLLKKYRIARTIEFWDKEDSDLKKHYASPALTSEEKKELKRFWKKYVDAEIPTTYYEVVKGIDKFSTDYISHSIYFAYLLPILNPREEACALSNKGMYSFFFKDVLRPKEIVKNIHGNYYNGENGLLTYKAALNTVLEYGEKIIVKPSIDSSRGRNVIILSDYSEKEITDIFEKYSKDFVIQEVIKQSEQTARFNPTSLNTFRITTLLLNGKFSVLSSQFRCGALGASVDNAGAGGIMIGIDSEGRFYKNGYSNGEIRTQSYNNLAFSDYLIEGFQFVYDFVESLHHRLPFCCIVGWDVALDVQNNPVLIEVNLKGPGIAFEQLCTGPAFGKRTQEVLEYVFNK